MVYPLARAGLSRRPARSPPLLPLRGRRARPPHAAARPQLRRARIPLPSSLKCSPRRAQVERSRRRAAQGERSRCARRGDNPLAAGRD